MTRTETTINETPTAITIEESTLTKREVERVFEKLQTILAEIRKTNGIIGFIMKNSTQAISDIDSADELTELAILASELFDSSKQLFKQLDGKTKSVVLEGSRMRILCMSVRGNQLSVFMEKSLDYCKVLDRILSQDA